MKGIKPMTTKEEFKVFIMLQEHKGTIPALYKYLEGSRYNHASISTDPNLEKFYSFRTKWGFVTEHPFNFKKKHKEEIQLSIYEVVLNEDNYFNIQESLLEFQSKKENLKFSYLGLIFGFLRIKHKFQKEFYCSRFVAETMTATTSIKLNKDSSIYLPSDFRKESFKLYFEGKAKDFKAHFQSNKI